MLAPLQIGRPSHTVPRRRLLVGADPFFFGKREQRGEHAVSTAGWATRRI
jgi:hypothetical protein